ncbi:hypothetical protein [Halomonas borealis]|uniref:hypothetical protein n=1 Tax=Halomonas borealis TaxID=2508710 RepID=UPI0010A05029|nr:hypothetical protein [Halomonas borealis]
MTRQDVAPDTTEQPSEGEGAQQNDEQEAGELETRQEAQEQKVRDLEQLESLLDREASELTADEIELRNELLEKYRSDVKQGIERVEVSQFSGPLPPPGVMANYDG